MFKAFWASHSWEAVNNHMHSCRSLDKPSKQARMLTEHIWIEIFLSCPGDLLARSLIWFSLEKVFQGYPPVNVRGGGENHEIGKQDDYGFVVDFQIGVSLEVWSRLCPSALFLMTFAMGGIPHVVSRQERKPEFPASTPDEYLGPGTYWRGTSRGPLQLAWRLDFPEAIWVGPWGPWGPCRNSRGTPTFLLLSGSSPVGSREFEAGTESAIKERLLRILKRD